MAIDFFGKGWLIDKWKEEKSSSEWRFTRSCSLDKHSFDEMIDFSVRNLKSNFPGMKIEAKSNYLFLSKSTEITGISLKSGENKAFWIRCTSRKLWVKIYGFDSERVLNCLS